MGRGEGWPHCSHSNKLTDKWYLFQNAIWNFLKMSMIGFIENFYLASLILSLMQCAPGHPVQGTETSRQPLQITYRLIPAVTFALNFASFSMHNKCQYRISSQAHKMMLQLLTETFLPEIFSAFDLKTFLGLNCYRKPIFSIIFFHFQSIESQRTEVSSPVYYRVTLKYYTHVFLENVLINTILLHMACRKCPA